MAFLNLLYCGEEFTMLVLIYPVLSVNSYNRLICGDFDNVEAINTSEFGFLRHSGTGHTGKLRVKTEEVLEGDCGEGFALVLNLYALLGFDSLMETLVKAASEHKTTCKFVNDYDFAVLNYIFDIKVHTAMSLYSLVNVV